MVMNCGYVVDMHHKHDGHKLYKFYMPEGKTVRYAYKKEIVRYIKKKDWKFMESLSKGVLVQGMVVMPSCAACGGIQSKE